MNAVIVLVFGISRGKTAQNNNPNLSTINPLQLYRAYKKTIYTYKARTTYKITLLGLKSVIAVLYYYFFTVISWKGWINDQYHTVLTGQSKTATPADSLDALSGGQITSIAMLSSSSVRLHRPCVGEAFLSAQGGLPKRGLIRPIIFVPHCWKLLWSQFSL